MAYARVGQFVISPRPALPRYWRRRRGIGDDYCYSGDAVIPCGSTETAQFPYLTSPVAATPPVVAPSSSANWDQFWQGITAGSLNLLGKVVAPPAYQQITRDAYGNVISTTVAQGGAPGTMAALGGGAISPNTLLIGGGVVAAIVLIMALKK